MEYLIEGITEDEMSKVIAGTCPRFFCGTFSDNCKTHCRAVGCTGGYTCSGFN